MSFNNLFPALLINNWTNNRSSGSFLYSPPEWQSSGIAQGIWERSQAAPSKRASRQAAATTTSGGKLSGDKNLMNEWVKNVWGKATQTMCATLCTVCNPKDGIWLVALLPLQLPPSRLEPTMMFTKNFIEEISSGGLVCAGPRDTMARWITVYAREQNFFYFVVGHPNALNCGDGHT